MVAVLVLALLLAFPRSAVAHLGHEVGSRLAVAQQLGPLVLNLVIETPPRTPGPLFVDVLVEEPAAATLLLAVVPRDGAVAADTSRPLLIAPDDPGPYTLEFVLPGPGDWELVVQTAAGAEVGRDGAGAVARVPFTVTPLSQPLAPRIALGALALGGGGLVAAFAVVGVAVRRRRALPRWLPWAVSHGLVVCLVVAGAAAVQAVAAPPADRLPAMNVDAASPPVNLGLRAEPATPRAGEPATLTLAFSDGATGRPVDDLAPHHEALVHAVLVSDDGEAFAHLHPARIGPGRFAIEATPPRPGPYTLYAEITRGGATQVVARPLRVAEAPSPAAPSAPSAAPAAAASSASPSALPRATTATAAGSRVRLAGGIEVDASVAGVDGTAPRAGEPATLRFNLSRDGAPLNDVQPSLGMPEPSTQHPAPSTQPISDLQPWLGMPGHLLVRSADGAVFAHVHAVGAMTPGVADPNRRYGPEIAFAFVFPEPGPYRVWFQFKHDNRVLTLPLLVQVAGEEER
jgi:hypothetical protein